MPTQEQLMSAIRNAHNAGDTESAQRLVNMYKNQEPQSDATKNVVDDMNGFERFAAGAGRSVVETGRGLRQVGAAIADSVPGIDLTEYRRALQSEINSAHERDRPLMETGTAKAGQFAGDLAQFLLPTGIASKVGGTALKAINAWQSQSCPAKCGNSSIERSQ